MKIVDVKQNLLEKNQQYADRLRKLFYDKKILVINFVSSPGSGKTSILEKTLPLLSKSFKIAVIEGDLQTEHDAERIRKAGINAIQINTGGACHLEAKSIEDTINKFDLNELDIIVIENVGNLVCPSSFDLGEHFKIVVISTTEGDDKPAKYPSMIRVSSAMIINKIDLLPYVDFDINRCIDYAAGIKSDLKFLQVSCKTGENIESIVDFIKEKILALKEN